MTILPPKDIAEFVYVNNGEFAIYDDATPEQKASFEKWKKEAEKLMREVD